MGKEIILPKNKKPETALEKLKVCCAFEGLSMGMAHHDLARFGMEVGRASPRRADLRLVMGTVTKRMTPRVKTLYEMMPEPKWGLNK